MKKFSMLMTLLVMVLLPIISFAGDIPESLLRGENTQTFIGEVQEITENSITLIQKHNFKGEFEEGSEQTYDILISELIPKNVKIGENVLCGYIDQNNLYLYKIKRFKNDKIELADDYAMTKRLEEYINNGDFAKAERERLAHSSGKDTGEYAEQSEPKEETFVKHPATTDIIGGADGSTSIMIIDSGMADIWKLVAIIGILVVIAGVLLVKRHKKK